VTVLAEELFVNDIPDEIIVPAPEIAAALLEEIVHVDIVNVVPLPIERAVADPESKSLFTIVELPVPAVVKRVCPLYRKLLLKIATNADPDIEKFQFTV
jgi:hypothetical protein